MRRLVTQVVGSAGISLQGCSICGLRSACNTRCKGRCGALVFSREGYIRHTANGIRFGYNENG
jgi:hypothetical protein